MLPNVKQNLKIAINNRCRILVIMESETESRMLEPCVLFTSKRNGLTLIARQIKGYSSSDNDLPMWQTFVASDFKKLTMLDERFDVATLDGFEEVRAKIKRTPNAEIRLDTPYTVFDTTKLGPKFSTYADDTMRNLKAGQR